MVWLDVMSRPRELPCIPSPKDTHRSDINLFLPVLKEKCHSWIPGWVLSSRVGPREEDEVRKAQAFFNTHQRLLWKSEVSSPSRILYSEGTLWAVWSFSTCHNMLPFTQQETYPRQQPNNPLHSRGANKEKKGQRGQEKPQQHLLRHTLGLSKFLWRPSHHSTTNYFCFYTSEIQ